MECYYSINSITFWQFWPRLASVRSISFNLSMIYMIHRPSGWTYRNPSDVPSIYVRAQLSHRDILFWSTFRLIFSSNSVLFPTFPAARKCWLIGTVSTLRFRTLFLRNWGQVEGWTLPIAAFLSFSGSFPAAGRRNREGRRCRETWVCATRWTAGNIAKLHRTSSICCRARPGCWVNSSSLFRGRRSRLWGRGRSWRDWVWIVRDEHSSCPNYCISGLVVSTLRLRTCDCSILWQRGSPWVGSGSCPCGIPGLGTISVIRILARIPTAAIFTPAWRTPVLLRTRPADRGRVLVPVPRRSHRCPRCFAVRSDS